MSTTGKFVQIDGDSDKRPTVMIYGRTPALAPNPHHPFSRQTDLSGLRSVFTQLSWKATFGERKLRTQICQASTGAFATSVPIDAMS